MRDWYGLCVKSLFSKIHHLSYMRTVYVLNVKTRLAVLIKPCTPHIYCIPGVMFALYYTQLGDPMQLLRITGTQAKIHLDPAVAAAGDAKTTMSVSIDTVQPASA